MATLKKRLPENVAGEFFVDSTCIDCGTCRQLACRTFGESGDFSYVYAQPQSADETHDALRALLCCPTGSIGTVHPNQAREVMADFPLPLDDGVYYNGFNSPKSFGGNSYFIQHPQGNWLIDSPKYLSHLVQRFEAMGGIRYIFLTHRDDVADADRYAETFKAQRIIYDADRSAVPAAETILNGDEPVELAKGFVVIPTPGHTRGHAALLYENRYLFSGDHLWGYPDDRSLGASQSVCWYSWPEQVRSMERLLGYSFEWVLPGHGDRIHLPPDVMHAALETLVRRMRQSLVAGTAAR
ncbi:MBL fold metallo-hydrolase [bacterium]|nr:MBL fold metallo-hydrolase [bacterium]